MADGTMRWISSSKHFGFMVPHDGSREVFVHFSFIEGFNNQELVVGQRVTFHAETDANGSPTTRVRPP